MKNFALIGAAGFIAPRHLKAIKDTGNQLIAALDRHDNVGIMDSHFPNADFFIEFERFDRHLDKLKRQGTKTDFVSICSPNYLHDSHIRFALRHGADAICEKPLVLNPWNVDALQEIENETGHRVNTILQLRHHPVIMDLKKKVEQRTKIVDVDLTYITSRGHWYFTSWKGDLSKSGGIATNIGIHFFDMLQWIFGSVKTTNVYLARPDKASGFLEFEKARVRWYLSVDFNDVPSYLKEKGQRTFRSISIEGEELEFSEGFTDLHTKSYESIVNGNGFGLQDAKPSIQIAHDIRHLSPLPQSSFTHPFALNK
jgi:UDP-N-acetyl-2-amino-2-deoxyglucuronate dehydrogenase